MNRLILIPVCFVALLVPVVVPAGGSQGGFDAVVNSIEARYHVSATRIPFLGIVNLVADRATQKGAGDVHVAEFDHFSAAVDGRELNQLVEDKLGPGWERMIRETSRHGVDQTLIFSRPEGQRMGLFILDLDGHEMDVVQVSVDPEHLNASIGKYSHHQSDDKDDADEDNGTSD
ncbi:MAG TPA: hypothetical protein VMU48_15480 [Terracidiphilus sp.]|nr:hypothetical protein [Terracidiphilus sp.]